MVGHIVFFVDLQYLLAVDVLALETIQKIGFLTGFQIVQDRFGGYGAVLRLEELGDAGGGKAPSYVGQGIGNDALQ